MICTPFSRSKHRTPGNLRAFIQASCATSAPRHVRTPLPLARSIEKVNVDEVDMQFLYADGDSYYFMDTRTTSKPT